MLPGFLCKVWEKEVFVRSMFLHMLPQARIFLTGVSTLAFLGVLGAVPSVYAVSNDSAANQYAQAEWLPPYDADSSVVVRRSSLPLLSQETIKATQHAIAQYENIVQRGGWSEPLLIPHSMKLGDSGDGVIALRERLALAGDLTVSPKASSVFDSYVVGALRQFQVRHGLKPTGELNQDTLEALNIPAETRLRQLKLNVKRLRNWGLNIPNEYAVINIPAAQTETVQDGVVVTRHEAGVGKTDRQSPIMKAPIIAINFNPFWTAPPTIVRKDLPKKMQENPNYLSDFHIRMYLNGKEVDPKTIDWSRLDQPTRYMFRQDPGAEFNSLGFVRINVKNSHGVYMHDTPERGIFGENYRFTSSGCVRIQNVRDYVAWLLKNNPGWNRSRINEVIESGQRLDVKLVSPVDVYWTYITAWGSENGVVNFRNDIYNKDGL